MEKRIPLYPPKYYSTRDSLPDFHHMRRTSRQVIASELGEENKREVARFLTSDGDPVR